MGADEREDRAQRAVEKFYGRAITLTPKGGGAPVQFDADYQDSPLDVRLGGEVDATMTEPRLDVRTATLEAKSLVPRTGDVVTFSLRSVSQSYKIIDVRKPGAGSTLLMLGDP